MKAGLLARRMPLCPLFDAVRLLNSTLRPSSMNAPAKPFPSSNTPSTITSAMSTRSPYSVLPLRFHVWPCIEPPPEA